MMNIDEITEERRKAVAKSIRPISAGELKTLTKDFFSSLDDPWLEKLNEFIHENAYESFHHATTDDGIHIIYCHAKGKGAWFLPGSGMGILQARGLKMMKDTVVGG